MSQRPMPCPQGVHCHCFEAVLTSGLSFFGLLEWVVWEVFTVVPSHLAGGARHHDSFSSLQWQLHYSRLVQLRRLVQAPVPHAPCAKSLRPGA